VAERTYGAYHHFIHRNYTCIKHVNNTLGNLYLATTAPTVVLK